MGFFDDLLSTATSAVGTVGEALAGIGGAVAQTAAPIIQGAIANPAGVAALLQQFGVIDAPQMMVPTGINPSGQSALEAYLAALGLGGNMPVNPDTGSMSIVASAGLPSILSNLPQILSGTVSGTGVGSVLGGAAGGAAADLAIQGLMGLFGGNGAGGGIQVIALSDGQRPPRRVVFRRPDGRQYEFTSRGRPLLYSGDVSATKRVARAASRARRSRPRRRALPAPPVETRVVCGKCLTSPCGC